MKYLKTTNLFCFIVCVLTRLTNNWIAPLDWQWNLPHHTGIRSLSISTECRLVPIVETSRTVFFMYTVVCASNFINCSSKQCVIHTTNFKTKTKVIENAKKDIKWMTFYDSHLVPSRFVFCACEKPRTTINQPVFRFTYMYVFFYDCSVTAFSKYYKSSICPNTTNQFHL